METQRPGFQPQSHDHLHTWLWASFLYSQGFRFPICEWDHWLDASPFSLKRVWSLWLRVRAASRLLFLTSLQKNWIYFHIRPDVSASKLWKGLWKQPRQTPMLGCRLQLCESSSILAADIFSCLFLDFPRKVKIKPVCPKCLLSSVYTCPTSFLFSFPAYPMVSRGNFCKSAAWQRAMPTEGPRGIPVCAH